MDNPEKLATLSTQDTWQRQTKQKTQHRKLKLYHTRFCIYIQEMFEDTKGVIRNHKSKDRQYNDQDEKGSNCSLVSSIL